jgi:hypothetical protein
MSTTVGVVIAVAGFFFLISLPMLYLRRRFREEEAEAGGSWGHQLTSDDEEE